MKQPTLSPHADLANRVIRVYTFQAHLFLLQDKTFDDFIAEHPLHNEIALSCWMLASMQNKYAHYDSSVARYLQSQSGGAAGNIFHIQPLTDTDTVLGFWNEPEEQRWMSNFYEAPIRIDGYNWLTVEHYYQAQKFIGQEIYYLIMQAPTPAKAKSLARKYDFSWSLNEKLGVMRQALHAKFDQHHDLQQTLLNTKDNILIEDSPHDYFWGTGKNGKGLNLLGYMLMELRQKLTQPIIVNQIA